MQERQEEYASLSEREQLRQDVIAKTIRRNESRARVREVAKAMEASERELMRVVDQLSALMSIGHFVGEILHKVDEERFIVQSVSGARHLVGYKKSIKPEKLKIGTRVALEITTLTIVRVLPREVDPQVYNMQVMENEKNISFQEIGGLQEQMRQMREVVELPLTNPELFVRVGISPPKGVLLYGPPGTGKTLLAKAIASNVDAAFLKIVASSIVDKYIGESARVLREMFAFARDHEPCIIFIDEVDAIGGKRIEGSSSDREVQRTLMELLHQMDGFEKLGKVKVIMATNRPDTLDPALMRPGRLDRKIEIGLPNEAGRLDVLKIHASKITKQGDIDYDSIVKLSEGFNGADLRNVCTEAGMFALRAGRDYVINEDFNKATRKVADSKKLESAPHQYSEQ
ncbi:Tbgamb.27571 protease regulatory ATPase subunit,putative [Trypanosoma brucei gambiense DAL972]|uniref:Tbgamb.27571 protease regulatory ATPase subunit,putative n=3 Tax=Trypanosoma brucei TaxID=5691 RepID=D0A259_TRYB9|nr:Tbgamb.27571 protease regulatory ATPase subunit,putative [Trypanosoma brucei gambiense DAL972]AAF91246.1 proteasome regulatory ATPase subunit 4 [Trypanosoma brucei]RHW69611.1 protease regulatory ATPase subunit 4 [Trypanosoma brucei equiperdum]CBH15353.1 Tbgamb.27571 protease regulatory ATPase subunit,putative [Trypanosoma brucei gambiense DAL972]|eukprot:XP_011777617.1 Tbgamb.27571 protease regulatory ATPase subunit,putative [Trypanosoma brucei gambiense DAL972]